MNSRPAYLSRVPRQLSLGGGAALALLLAAVPAWAQSLATARGDLLLASADGRSFVQRAGEDRVALPLSKAARVSDFRSGPEAWFAAAVDRDGGAPRLVVLTGRDGGVEALGAPVDPAAELLQPVFVAGSDEIHALVWLAGEAHHRLAVRASRWLGSGWAAPETVSPPARGTQLALSTTFLADGSWLLVWAAFDGRDDEILWSRQADGAWSPPRPIAADNAVPDITPSLFATAAGALVAWSRYDGNDYRVNVARYSGEGWTAPEVVGPRGSTAPAFSDAASPYLTYHLADPQAWAVMELDASGRVLRQAAIELVETERPVLAAVTAETVTLEWRSLEKLRVSAPLAWTVP